MAVSVHEGDVITARLNFRDEAGNQAFNLLHYRLRLVTVAGGGLYPGEDWADVGVPLATAIFDMLAPDWEGLASQQVTMTGVTVQDIYPAPRSRAFTYTPAGGIQGDQLFDALPLQDAPTILKRSVFGERWGLGRIFVVGMAENHQAAGRLTAPGMAFLEAWCAVLANEVQITVGANTFFFRPTLFSPNSGPGGTARTTEITTIEPSDDVIKTQRRRRPGKGI